MYAAGQVHSGMADVPRTSSRDMRRELEEWRQQRQSGKTPTKRRARSSCGTPPCGSNENTPSNWAMPWQVLADGNPGSKMPIESSWKTPVKRRCIPIEAGGVLHNTSQANAVSPLTEICQNTGMLTMSGRPCRASAASPVSGSPHDHRQSLASPSRPAVASPAPAASSSVIAAAPQCSAASPRVHATSNSAVATILSAWEDQRQAPGAPPPSPATPFQELPRRPTSLDPLGLHGCSRAPPAVVSHCLREALAAVDLQEGSPASVFFHGPLGSAASPTSAAVSTPMRRRAAAAAAVPDSAVEPSSGTEASPARRQLLAHLEETELEEAGSPAVSPLAAVDLEIASPLGPKAILPALSPRSLPFASDPAEEFDDNCQGDAWLWQSDHWLQEEGEEQDEVEEDRPDEQAEEDFAAWRDSIQEHQMVWTNPTVLDMEDHLSRAHDIEAFWFFEARDRANIAVQAELRPVPCKPILEYPADWPQWRIDSFNMRDAMRSARADSARRERPRPSDLAVDDTSLPSSTVSTPRPMFPRTASAPATLGNGKRGSAAAGSARSVSPKGMPRVVSKVHKRRSIS